MKVRAPGRLAIAGGLLAVAVAACTGDVARPHAAEEEGTPSAFPRVRRLSLHEYRSSVFDLLGVEVDASIAFPPDALATGYDNGATSLDVSLEQAAAYQSAAERAAEAAVAQSWSRFADACPESAAPAVCRDRTIEGFGRRAYRRPLRDAEKARLRAVFDAAFAQDGLRGAVRTTIEAMLQSPAFLYRAELGGAIDGGRLPLDGWERATALSFFLTGSTPDDALLDAAARGDLGSAEGVRTHARRLLATPAAHAQLRRFVEQWLALDRLERATKDPAAFPEFDASLRASMIEETRRFLDDAIAEGRGTLRDLMTSRATFVDARVATIYGVSAPSDGFVRVELDPALRSGVLTRAGYLTAHSSPEDTSPVERGLFARSALLCASMPAPPPGINRNVPRSTERTTRARFAEHDANPRCQACHAAIDGVGFGFEEFDPIGRHRPFEASSPVDATGVLMDADAADGPFRGVVELEARLLASPRLSSCFVRQVFRFAMGSGEQSSDETSLRVLARGFSVDTPIADLFVEMATSRAMLERWTP